MSLDIDAVATRSIHCYGRVPALSITSSGARFIGPLYSAMKKVGIYPWYRAQWRIDREHIIVWMEEPRKRTPWKARRNSLNSSSGLKRELLALGYQEGHVVPLFLVRCRADGIVFKLGEKGIPREGV